MISMGTTAEASRDQFLQLLVTQLRYQDPLEPVKQENFLQQLAQFSTLEGIEQLNASFEDMLKLQEITQGSHLIGAKVAYHRDSDAALESGRVDGVSLDSGNLVLSIEGNAVPLDAVYGVMA